MHACFSIQFYNIIGISSLAQVTDRTVVCSDHFEDNCYYRRAGANRRLLLPTAVPTKFKWHRSPKKRRPLIRFSKPVVDSDSERTVTASSESEAELDRYRTTVTFSADVRDIVLL